MGDVLHGTAGMQPPEAYLYLDILRRPEVHLHCVTFYASNSQPCCALLGQHLWDSLDVTRRVLTVLDFIGRRRPRDP